MGRRALLRNDFGGPEHRASYMPTPLREPPPKTHSITIDQKQNVYPKKFVTALRWLVPSPDSKYRDISQQGKKKTQCRQSAPISWKDPRSHVRALKDVEPLPAGVTRRRQGTDGLPRRGLID